MASQTVTGCKFITVPDQDADLPMDQAIAIQEQSDEWQAAYREGRAVFQHADAVKYADLMVERPR
jgi:hypothetical protein